MDGHFPFVTDWNLDGDVISDTLTLTLIKHELYAKGTIYSNETQEKLSNVQVILKHANKLLSDTLITSTDGSYSFPLAPEEHYEIIATVEGYLSDGFRINTKSLFEGELLNDILLEQNYVDKMVTFFDFNQHELKKGYHQELKALIRTLNKFSDATLKVTAHADARGTEEYNKRLSQRRVDAITRYFVNRGIKQSRIHGTAFGEELLLNTCSDGVECEEEDHSQNRRAELKVQMELN